MDLHIVAGPNGAGKTTFAQEFLPNYADCRNFVNADLIARGIAPFSPETAAIRAGRMMLTEIQSFAQKRVSFAFETTLSGRSYLGLLRRLKAQGYKIHFYFLWVEKIHNWQNHEFGNAWLEAGTAFPVPLFTEDFRAPCETSFRNIAVWQTAGSCLTTPLLCLR